MSFSLYKVGGSLLKSYSDIDIFADHFARLFLDGQRIVVVVSAIKGRTDALLSLAGKKMDDRQSHEALDLLLSLGEQETCALLALALQRRNIPVVVRSGLRVGIQQVKQDWVVDTDLYACCRDHVVVVSGFQALNEAGRLMTLGRGGSDLTAIILAKALQVDRCVLLKDVAGIAKVDPHFFPGFPYFNQLSFRDLFCLVSFGNPVVQKLAVDYAWQHRVNFSIENLNGQGTQIGSYSSCLLAERNWALTLREVDFNLNDELDKDAFGQNYCMQYSKMEPLINPENLQNLFPELKHFSGIQATILGNFNQEFWQDLEAVCIQKSIARWTYFLKDCDGLKVKISALLRS